MNQKELNEVYRDCRKLGDQKFYEKLEALLGKHNIIIYDWKEHKDSVQQFIDFLQDEEYTVLYNPEFKNTDTYSWIIFNDNNNIIS